MHLEFGEKPHATLRRREWQIADGRSSDNRVVPIEAVLAAAINQSAKFRDSRMLEELKN